MNYFTLLLSVLPFVIFLFLLVVKKKSLLLSSFVAFLLYSFLVLFYFKITPYFFYFSIAKGFFVALDIFFIIFGAILFIELLKDLNIIQKISGYLEDFSKDYRIQIIIIAWFFENFLEGTAGFGVPAAVALPLLLGIGLSPMKALIVGLLGNSTAGLFGAAGTPIGVGLAGIASSTLPHTAALINCVGFIVPIFMMWIVTRDRENANTEFKQSLPIAIFSGVIFVALSYLITFFGQEFPTILGSLIGLIIVLVFIKFKIFVPKNLISLKSNSNPESTRKPSFYDFLKSFTPYIILIFSLIAGKILIGSYGLNLNIGFSHKFSLFNPGFAFIVTSMIVFLFWKSNKNVIKDSIKKSFNGALAPFLVIVFMSSIVQFINNSGQNISGIPAIFNLIIDLFETKLLPFFAPFIGAFGSFLTGSVTISNIMFGGFWNGAAISLGFNPTIIISLGVVGAVAGNMIALADILAAEAVVGVKNSEIKIIKGVLFPCLSYLLLVGIIGLLIFNI